MRLDGAGDEALRPGLVLAHYGTRCLVEDDGGEAVECTLPRRLKPVCGDRVEFRALPHGGHLERIEPRRSEFPRVDARGRPRVIAANLDRVLVVLAPEPEPTRFLIDRYLVAIHSVGVEPVLVANKSDLPSHTGLLDRLGPYGSLGYPVVATCAKDGSGVDELRDRLRDATGILAGQSGVGKSRLARCLLPDVDISTAELSKATGKGRHTTTTARLFHLPGGGSLVDTPGVWEYGLWKMPPEVIESGFVEFRPHLGKCRFRNCRHKGEPGCAFVEASERGEISETRLTSYRQIVSEMEE